MPLRPPAGFIRPGFDPLKNPDAPTAVSASGGDESASVEFTAPANVGGSAISAYYAVSNPGQFTGTAASSPVSVTGLTNGTPYTFTVWALNTYGPGPYSAASGSATPTAPTGIFAGGFQLPGFTYLNVIQYINISSTGNTQDYGDLTNSVSAPSGGVSSSTRGIWGGGVDGTRSNVIQYITFGTLGNATDFGDLTFGRSNIAGFSNSSRGCFAGGNLAEYATNIVDYVTIASVGNATDFGDLAQKKIAAGSCASSTRGVVGGGYDNAIATIYATIGYFTIATTGDSTNFGNLVGGTALWFITGCSNNTRGIFAGGLPSTNVIQYITIASTGNAIDFGDLTVARYGASGVSSSTRAVFAGGISDDTNVMDYVTIASTGNATDFGDLYTNQTGTLGGISNAHGGL